MEPFCIASVFVKGIFACLSQEYNALLIAENWQKHRTCAAFVTFWKVVRRKCKRRWQPKRRNCEDWFARNISSAIWSPHYSWETHCGQVKNNGLKKASIVAWVRECRQFRGFRIKQYWTVSHSHGYAVNSKVCIIVAKCITWAWLKTLHHNSVSADAWRSLAEPNNQRQCIPILSQTYFQTRWRPASRHVNTANAVIDGKTVERGRSWSSSAIVRLHEHRSAPIPFSANLNSATI